jgi:hypothetical protein
MKVMLGNLVAALFVLSISACAADDPSADPQATATSAVTVDTASSDAPKSIEVPGALTLEKLLAGSTVDGNTLITPDACHVTLKFCKDPSFGIPSFCSNGCTFAQSVNAAVSLCHSVCGPRAACNNFEDLGGC